MDNSKVLLGFLAGIAAGVGLYTLSQTEEGKKMVDKMKDTADKLSSDVKSTADKLASDVNDLIRRGKNAAQTAMNEAEDVYDEAKDAVDETKREF